jgi:hypothetical protein
MITVQAEPWIRNTSIEQQMTHLFNTPYRSPFVDNGEVLFAEVKPVTNYDRYFLRDFIVSQVGYNRSDYADGSSYGAAFNAQFLPGTKQRIHIPYNSQWYNPGSTVSVLYGSPPSINDWLPLRGQLAARAKALGFDAATFLAERRKTADYLRSAVPKFMRSAARAVQSAARGSRRGTGRALDSIGDEWLAARYGLRPLLYDIENAVKAYEIGLGGFLRAFSQDSSPPASGSLGSWLSPKATFQSSKTVSNAAGNINCSTSSTVVDDYTCRGSAGISSFLQSAVTFNPSLTALELIPLSFLLGWVSNIPEQLIAHAPVFDRSVLYYCLGMKRSKTIVFQARWLGEQSFFYYIVGNSGTTTKGWHRVDATQTTTIVTDVYKRERIEPTDVPWVLTTSFNLSALQLADLAALAKQWSNRIRRI